MPVDTALYEILGVRPNASDGEIKKSYHKLAREYHPDKNAAHGDKFKEISYAYEVLANPEKREIYDRRGLDGLKEGDGGGADVFDRLFGGGLGGLGGGLGGFPFGGGGGGLFSSMFGGGGGGGRRRRARGEDTLHPLKVSLEEFYNGATKKLQLGKNVICNACNGIGGKEGSSVPCEGCRGRGVKITMRQLGPGMIQQMQSVCSDCRGQGSRIAEKDRCKVCEGSKTVKETKLLEVHIDRGMREGQRVFFRGEGDQEPGVEPGDVVIVLQSKEHETFIREGDNLFIKHKINLTEALCGTTFLIRHLDGRDIAISSAPSDVLDPGAVRGLIGEGMPRHRMPDIRGNLYVKFEVDFPEDGFLQDPAKFQALEKLLPPRPKEKLPHGEGVEEVNLMPFEERHAHDQGGPRDAREAYNESDDEDAGGHPGVACHQQ